MGLNSMTRQVGSSRDKLREGGECWPVGGGSLHGRRITVGAGLLADSKTRRGTSEGHGGKLGTRKGTQPVVTLPERGVSPGTLARVGCWGQVGGGDGGEAAPMF